MIYAGIGSRWTPDDALALIRDWSRWFARAGLTLRSDGPFGASGAFERGCDDMRGRRQIYSHVMPEWIEHASQFHPEWERCRPETRLLYARKSAIILGSNLNDSVKMVVCYTRDGKDTGRTGQALRVARAHNIPVFNLYHGTDELREFIR